MLDYYDIYKNHIDRICKALNLKQILLKGRDMGDKPTLNELCSKTDPRSFINLIQHASIVLCDGFHGCCLSIANNVDFIYLNKPNVKNIDGRLKDLFNRFGLKERVISIEHDYNINNIPINWIKVNKKVDIERKRSIQFLINALKEN